MVTCSSSALSAGSPYISHHLPRIAASLGRANCQSFVSLNASAGISLYAAGVATGGFTYFGALSQLLNKNSPSIVMPRI